MSELRNRVLSPLVVLLHGAVLGALAYAIAETTIPRSLLDPFEHDLRLAQRLGLIYPPLIGLWLGWVQRSWSRSLRGTIVGGGIGAAYYFLCAGRNFLAIMVAFPCLLGAAFAGFVGSNRSRPLEDAVARTVKGLVAGFALGSASRPPESDSVTIGTDRIAGRTKLLAEHVERRRARHGGLQCVVFRTASLVGRVGRDI